MQLQYNFEDNIQRSIVYLCKSSEDFLIQALPLIKSDYFEDETYQKIYTVIEEHYLEYKEIPLDSQIIEEIKPLLGKGETVGHYRSEITSINEIDTIAFSNTEYYLEKVEEFAKKQAFSLAVVESLDDIKGGKFETAFERIRTSLSVGRKQDLGISYFDDITERYSEEGARHCEFPTVYSEYNDHLDGGLARGELAMVVAPPGVGKSVYLANQAVELSKNGYNVLYISLEMDERRVSSRLDSIFTHIPVKDLRFRVPELNARLNMVKEKIPNLGEIKVKQFPTKQCSISQLRAYITQLENYENFKPDVLVIDYLDILSSDSINKYDAQQELAENLRGLAIEKNILVWTATQTNREGTKVSIITDAELADCYGKIRVCDFAISLNQTEEEFDNGVMRVYSMKNRNGIAKRIVTSKIYYPSLVMKAA